ncbi:hypothetical protein ACFV4N_27870 [Actinosynnema sp. NPDC059797]
MEESGCPSTRVDRTTPVANPIVAQFAQDTRFAEPLMPGIVDSSLVYDDVFEPAIRRIGNGGIDPENGLADGGSATFKAAATDRADGISRFRG